MSHSLPTSCRITPRLSIQIQRTCRVEAPNHLALILQKNEHHLDHRSNNHFRDCNPEVLVFHSKNYERIMQQQHMHSKFARNTHRLRISSKFASFSTACNSTTCQEKQYPQHPCGHDPEYLEIVTQTAERMKSAVRAYVAGHSSNNCGEKSNIFANSE